MKLKKLHRVLIMLSLSLIALIYINYKIYNHFIESSGKTKALFGLIEALQYSYKYYFLIPELISGILIFRSYKIHKTTFTFKTAIVLLIITLLVNISPIWKLFI